MYTAYMRVEVIGRTRNMVKARVQLSENDEICLYTDESQLISLMEGTIPISWIRRYAEQFPEDQFPFKKMLEAWENV